MGPYVKQAWCASAVLLNMVAQGMGFGFPSCLLPALRGPDAEIQADLQTASWISSSVGLGGIPGFFISSYCMEKFGRRIAHGLVMLPGALGWLLIFFAADTTTLIIGRFSTGITAGATVGLGAVVIGEFSCPHIRGVFLNLKTASVCLGGMISHILGNFFYWRTVALISLVPYVLSLLIIMTWPESPAWLALKGKYDRSKKAFYWLRGKDETCKKELDEMLKAQMAAANKEQMTFKVKVKDFFKKFTRRDFLMPIIIITLGALLLEVSGRHLFPAYALDIMGQITGNKDRSFYFTLALDLIITTSSISSSFLVKVMKRRTLLFTTGFAAVGVLAIACTYLFLVSRDVISKDYTAIPIGLFVLFFILSNLGCAPIPLAFLGELLPLAHRGAGSAVAGIVMSLQLNLGLQVTPFLLEHTRVYGTFTVLGATMAVLLVILYFIVPETKDKTLQEIEDYFNFGSFKDNAVKDDDEEVKNKMISKDTNNVA